MVSLLRWVFVAIGYRIRPYDMLADRRRWWWQKRVQCCRIDLAPPVGFVDSGDDTSTMEIR